MLKRWLYPLTLAISLSPITSWAADCADPAAIQENTGGCSDESTGRSDILFSYGGQVFSKEDLDLTILQSLYELELQYHEGRQKLLENALWQVFLAQEAKRQQKSEIQLAKELLGVRTPSDSETKAFYDANRKQIPAPYEQVKDQLVNYIAQQMMLSKQAQLVAGLKQSGQFELLIAKPQPPVAIIDTEGFPSKGGKFAPVEIVEFADYQCPHCKTGSEVVKKLAERYGEKVRVIYMDYPINRSGISRKVAEGGVCADQQGKFWAYHENAFKQQASLSEDSPLALAKELELDTQRFSDCLADDKTREKVGRSKSEARRLGLSSTPSFFINGVKVTAHDNLERELADAIDQALKAAGS